MLTQEERTILDNAPEWATVLLEKVCDGMSEYAIEKCGSFWDMQDVSQHNPYGNAFVAAAWNIKHDIALLRKEQEDKHQKIEWNGEGLPPVGAECLIMYSSDNYMGVITYMGDGVGCFRENKGGEYAFSFNAISFKKLETPKQKSAREREEKAGALLEIAFPHKKWGGDGVCGTSIDLRNAILKLVDAGVKLQ